MANTTINRELTYELVDDKNILSLIETVRKGVNMSYFLNLADKIPISLHEWSQILNISERTLQRYKKESRSFDTMQSERILQITLLYHLGVEVFGDEEKLNNWLNIENLALGGIKPKELFDNSFGINLIKDELTRIEQGVLS